MANKEITSKVIFQDICERYSSLFRLQTVVARCRRFILNCKNSDKQTTTQQYDKSVVSASEIQQALISLIKGAQNLECTFKEEINLLTNQKQLFKQSKVRCLNPFIDDRGLLRVGGRIQQANISYGRKHPIILASNHNLTKLIIDDVYKRYFHAGQQLVLNILNMRYRIIGGKNAVKRCIRNCVVCTRYRAETQQQQMGRLPSYRIEPSRPFTNTGTDFAGPFVVRAWHGRGAKQLKCYIAIFVCMATKALHLELVTDLSTDMFLAAMHRFISRRGACKNMYSDNGRNYTGAARQLRDLQGFLRDNHQIISKELCQHEINWHFIPVSTPHFSGMWELAVKSVKYHIKRVVGETCLTFEQMSTLLCQIEACLNSRPIAPKTDYIEDLEPLTPAHFLTQGPMLLPAHEQLDEATKTFRSRWQQVQHMYQCFWKSWNLEYICNLQKRKKWALSTKNIKVNDLVLIKQENIPPGRWLMGRVTETKFGSDGLIRVVTLRTKNGSIKRSIHKLVVLPSEESTL